MTVRVAANGPFKTQRASGCFAHSQRKAPCSVEVTAAYADGNFSGTETLPLDELATVVALKLMGIEGDPTKK
jgi:hypothetical protein